MLKDHLELYKSLNKNKVRYLVIGGIASIMYGVPRTTLDIDLFIEPTIKNCKRLLKALKQIGFATAHLTTPEKIVKNEINVFVDFIRLDVITKPKGLIFENSWKFRKLKRIKGINIKLASINDIIKSKKASNRRLAQIPQQLCKIKFFKADFLYCSTGR